MIQPGFRTTCANLYNRALSFYSGPVLPVLLCLISFSLVIGLFFPLLKAEYLFHYDDGTNFLHNPWVINTQLTRIWKIFFTANTANQTFVPLSVLTFFLENYLWGLHATVSHLINIVLHLSVVVLLYQFARLTGASKTGAYIAALIFAIHPLHVEPVAWVSARKDLLFSLFYLVSLIQYCRYIKEDKPRHYCLSLLTGFLSILSKPMAISLPLSLFLIDHLMQRKFDKKSLLEKLPFFLTILPVGWITYAMNARSSFFVWPDSLLFWFDCGWFYISKFFWPSDLTPLILPNLNAHWNLSRLIFSFLPLATCLFVALFSKNRLVFFSFMFYVCGTFFLWRCDLGVDLNYVAARFMYLPSIGFCILTGICFEQLFRHSKLRYFIGPFLFILIISFLVLSARQVRIWNNSCVFWREITTRNPGFPEGWRWLAASYNNGGEGCATQVARIIAKDQKTSLIKFRKKYSESYYLKIDIVRLLLSLRYSRNALNLNPEGSQELNYVGRAFLFLGSPLKALYNFDRAIELAPYEPLHYLFRARTHAALAQYEKAIIDYARTIALGHISAEIFSERADLLMAANRPIEALEDLKKVLVYRPLNREVYSRAFLAAIKSSQQEFASDLFILENKLFPNDNLLDAHKRLLEQIPSH